MVSKIGRKRYRRKRAHKRKSYAGYMKYTKGPTRVLGITTYPFPNQLFCKLNYADNYKIIGAGAGLLGTQTWRLNDITDPDYTGTGHQVYYNDQLAPIYRKYCVYGAKITVDICPSVSSVAPTKVMLRARAYNTTAPSDPDLEEERLRSKYILLPSGENDQVRRLSMYMPCSALFGKTKSQILTEEAYSANTSASSTSSPTDKGYFTLTIHSMDPAGQPVCYANVKIVYYVKFYERQAQGQS